MKIIFYLHLNGFFKNYMLNCVFLIHFKGKTNENYKKVFTLTYKFIFIPENLFYS